MAQAKRRIMIIEELTNEIEQETEYWPESLQKPLLRAAFLSGEAGLRAWAVWKSQVNMDDHPDPGSFRLLPQLYRNLQSQGISDPLMMKLKGIARKAWYNNQRYFRSILSPLQALHQVGIETMLLYGPALALNFHSDYALREQTILPILVRPEQAIDAIKQLQALGWESEARLPSHLIEPYITVGFMHFFNDAKERRIQLHWHPLPECNHSEADEDFWEGAVSTNLNNVPIFTLNPADQILHICAQDTSLAEASLFLRAIYVMLVIRATETGLDWERLIRQAQQHRLLVPVMKVLHYLQENLDEPLPPEIWQRLKTLPISRGEQIEYNLKTSRIVVWRRFSRLWFNYLRRSNERHLLQKIMGFPRYLQHFWRLEHMWQVPLQAVSAAQARLRRTN